MSFSTKSNKVEKVSKANSSLLLLVPVPIGITVALITGLFILVHNSNYYGFPVPWRLAFCSVQSTLGCLPYHWAAFEVDALFFTALAYGFVLAYKRTKHYWRRLES